MSCYGHIDNRNFCFEFHCGVGKKTPTHRENGKNIISLIIGAWYYTWSFFVLKPNTEISHNSPPKTQCSWSETPRKKNKAYFSWVRLKCSNPNLSLIIHLESFCCESQKVIWSKQWEKIDKRCTPCHKKTAHKLTHHTHPCQTHNKTLSAQSQAQKQNMRSFLKSEEDNYWK